MSRKTLRISGPLKARIKNAGEDDATYGLVMALASPLAWWHEVCELLIADYAWPRSRVRELIQIVDKYLPVAHVNGRVNVAGIRYIMERCKREIQTVHARPIPLHDLVVHNAGWIYNEIYKPRRVIESIVEHVRARVVIRGERERLTAFLKGLSSISEAGQVNAITFREECDKKAHWTVEEPRFKNLEERVRAKIDIDDPKTVTTTPQRLIGPLNILAAVLKTLREEYAWPGNVLEHGVMVEILTEVRPNGEDVEELIEDLQEADLISEIFSGDGTVYHVRAKRVPKGERGVKRNVQGMIDRILNGFYGREGLYDLADERDWITEVVPPTYISNA